MHNGMGYPIGYGMPMPGFAMMPGGHIPMQQHHPQSISSVPSQVQHGRPVQQHSSYQQPQTIPHQQNQPQRQNPPQARSNISSPAVNNSQSRPNSVSQTTAVQPLRQTTPSQPQTRQSNAAQPSRTSVPGQVNRPASSTAKTPLSNGNSVQPKQLASPQKTAPGQAVPSVQARQAGGPPQAVRQPAPKPVFITELWVVRHGETPENKTRTIAGQNASGLTSMGVKQANLLAERLRGMRFHTIFLSDLNRTKQTADPVLKALPSGIPAFTDSRLREKAAGQYEGFKIGYIEQMTRYSGLPHRVFRPPGGESWEDVCARSRSFMKDVLEKHCVVTADQEKELQRVAQADGNGTGEDGVKKVLIITHGGFISEFLSFAIGAYGNTSKNCSLSILGIKMTHQGSRPQFYMKLTNDIEHLSSIGAPVPPPNPQPLRRTPQPHATPSDRGASPPSSGPSVASSAEPMRAEEYFLDPPGDAGCAAEPLKDEDFTATAEQPEEATTNEEKTGTGQGPVTVDTDDEGAAARPAGHEVTVAPDSGGQSDGSGTPTVRLDGLALNLNYAAVAGAGGGGEDGLYYTNGLQC